MTDQKICTYCKMEFGGLDLVVEDRHHRPWHTQCVKDSITNFEPPKGVQHSAEVAYEDCNGHLLLECVKHFKGKQGDYGGTFLELGSIGQFSDMNRKMGKLRLAILDGRELRHESPEEITKDLFGHVLLLLYCLREEI